MGRLADRIRVKATTFTGDMAPFEDTIMTSPQMEQLQQKYASGAEMVSEEKKKQPLSAFLEKIGLCVEENKSRTKEGYAIAKYPDGRRVLRVPKGTDIDDPSISRFIWHELGHYFDKSGTWGGHSQLSSAFQYGKYATPNSQVLSANKEYILKDRVEPELKITYKIGGKRYRGIDEVLADPEVSEKNKNWAKMRESENRYKIKRYLEQNVELFAEGFAKFMEDPAKMKAEAPDLYAVFSKMASEHPELKEAGYKTVAMKASASSDDEYLAAVERGDIEAAQQMVDAAAKAAGYDKLLFHGTWGDYFNAFRKGSHFSAVDEYAKRFESPSASSLGWGGGLKEAKHPRTMRLWVKMDRPFDTRNKKARDIFNNEFYRKYGTGTPLQETGLPDWNDGIDLDDFLKEFHPEFDGIVLDEGGEPVGDDVRKRPGSYIPLSPNQIKSADPVTRDDAGNIIPLSKRFNSASNDIRAAKSAPSYLPTIEQTLEYMNSSSEGGYYDLYPAYSQPAVDGEDYAYDTKEKAYQQAELILGILGDLPDPVDAWRAIYAKDVGSIRKDWLGESWSFEKEAALEFGSHARANFLLHAKIPRSAIDWDRTVREFTINSSDPKSGESEFEVVVDDFDKIHDLEIYQIKGMKKVARRNMTAGKYKVVLKDGDVDILDMESDEAAKMKNSEYVASVEPVDGLPDEEGVGEKSFSVNETLIMHSPHSHDDSEVSFRGYEGDKAVVWTGTLQIAVPKEWLRRPEAMKSKANAKKYQITYADGSCVFRDMVPSHAERMRNRDGVSAVALMDLPDKKVKADNKYKGEYDLWRSIEKAVERGLLAYVGFMAADYLHQKKNASFGLENYRPVIDAYGEIGHSDKLTDEDKSVILKRLNDAGWDASDEGIEFLWDEILRHRQIAS